MISSSLIFILSSMTLKQNHMQTELSIETCSSACNLISSLNNFEISF